MSESGAATSLETVLLSLLATFVLSQLVAWLYMWTHRGMSYTASLAQSLVALSLIVALVMLMVGDSLARAFGLFGALALIRFRTPIKDARDTVFLFFAVAVGIATGSRNLMAATTGTLVIGLILSYLYVVRFGSRYDHDGLVRFRCVTGGEEERRAQEALRRICESFTLLHVREAGPQALMEFAYQIKLFDKSHGSHLVRDIVAIDGVSDLSLLMQDGEAQP